MSRPVSPGETDFAVVPVLPLKDMVVYPHGVHPLFVGTKRSILALDAAMAADKQILLVAKRDPDIDDPGQDDVFKVGTVSTVLQLLKLPDGTVKVLVEGGYRARILDFDAEGAHISARVERLPEQQVSPAESKALVRSVMAQLEQYGQTGHKLPQELLTSLASIDEPGRLVDTIAAQVQIQLEDKQRVLEAADLDARIETLLSLMEAEVDLFQIEKRIRGRVKKQMEKSQREYYLNEQMKAIQKELGDLDGAPNEFEDLARRIEEAGMPAEARERANAELGKLKMMAPMSAEATVVRSYLDWLLNVPWKKRTRVRSDLSVAQRILDEDHFGLQEVKDRILEFLAVQRRVRKIKGPVLCLVGPPGVGKTSLGESIARATNRKFVRMALGGVRDEAEIRGHRRTYIGSMPGKVLQKMAKAGVRNPLFLLDEVDKMGMDVRGDPASALLEVLDPEQNHAFNDHYLEIDYDLSSTFFVCTSNSMNIPPALLDRMEIIRIPGYTEDEKLNIARRFLIPKQTRNAGLRAGSLEVTDEAIIHLIRYYTREAGVRGLERDLAKIARKVVREQVQQGHHDVVRIDPEAVEKYVGVRRFTYGVKEEEDQIGAVTGLAWTEVGGEILNIEAAAVPGKGRQTRTGSLGDVMQESIQAAITFVRSRARTLGIAPDFHEKYDLHVHVPEGATPKDGPSAGIGMCTALVSALTGIPVRSDVAMTGEITLRGQVLAIGGLKEKLLAAHRAGLRCVIIPQENERDLREIPENVKSDLEIVPVQWMDRVLELALQHMPEPLAEAAHVASDERTTGAAEGDGVRISTH